MKKIKCPRKLDISVFYQLTKRLPHKDLNYDEGLITFTIDSLALHLKKLLTK